MKTAAELFVLYASTLLGREVEYPVESFAGLSEAEQKAWGAEAKAQNSVKMKSFTSWREGPGESSMCT